MILEGHSPGDRDLQMEFDMRTGVAYYLLNDRRIPSQISVPEWQLVFEEVKIPFPGITKDMEMDVGL